MLIPQGLLAKSLRRTGEGLLNLKDLLIVFPSSGRSIFSGFVGRLKRDEGYLLIPQGLLAKLRRRTGEGLLNLKDLLTVFSPSLKRLFENEPVLRLLLCAESHQILPFSDVCPGGGNRQSLYARQMPLVLQWRAIGAEIDEGVAPP